MGVTREKKTGKLLIQLPNQNLESQNPLELASKSRERRMRFRINLVEAIKNGDEIVPQKMPEPGEILDTSKIVIQTKKTNQKDVNENILPKPKNNEKNLKKRKIG